MMDLIRGASGDDEEEDSLVKGKALSSAGVVGETLKAVMHPELMNKPLFLMPGAY